MKINYTNQKIKKFIHAIQYNELKFAISLIGICFSLRLLAAIFLFSENQIDSWADSKEYLWFGEQFALGNFNPYWDVENHGLIVGPYVPILIAFFIKLFGSPLWPFFIYNCLITSFLTYVIYLLGKNIFNRKVGLLSALWSIFYTDFFRFNIQLLKEPTIYFFLPLTILLVVLSIRNKNKIIFLFGSSTAFSISMHADPRYFFFIPVILIPYLFINWTLIERLKTISLWMAFCLFFSMPMLIRNYNVYGEIIFISPQTISITNKLWKSNVEPYNKSFNQRLLDSAMSNFENDNQSSAEEKYFNSRFENALKQSGGEGRKPYRYGKYEKYFMAMKHYWQATYFTPNYLYRGFRYQKWSLKHNFSSLVFYGIFLPFYLFGFFLTIRNKNLIAIYIAIIPLFHSFMHTFALLPLERYRSHINFCIIIIGFWVIDLLYKNFTKKEKLVPDEVS